jgi:N-acetylglucosamine kinase-like BadF-type ATPase
MKLYLGVDGGQSATKAIVGGGEGRVLGRGSAGPCNHVRSGQGREKLTAALTAAVEAALAPTGLRLKDVRFEGVCCGMSGGPDDKREIVAEVLPANHLEVTTDAHTALLGATGGGPGVIVIAGTGSIALARGEDGRTARAGGWGYIFGDEGGAFDLVRRALRAGLRFEEGWGPPTALRQALLARVPEAANLGELLHLFYTDAYPRSRVAAFAGLVEEAAEQGDRAAQDVLEQAGRELARLGIAARNQLFVLERRAAVSFTGGVFRSGRVRRMFESELRAHPGCELCEPLYGPDAGALLGAYLLCGVSGQEIRE